MRSAYFFFASRRRHTRSDRDWSSDVCSSDLYLGARYNVTYGVMSAQAAIDAYVRRAAGVVVYDPSRPESIDVGTVLAAQQDAVLAGPELAGWRFNRYAPPTPFDYPKRPDWTSPAPLRAYA